MTIRKKRQGLVKMEATVAIALLCLLTVPTVHAQEAQKEGTPKSAVAKEVEALDPEGDILKSVKPTPSQKKKIEAIFEKNGKGLDSYFDKMGARFGEKFSSTILTKYADDIKAIDALPQEEQDAKLAPFMKKAMAEVMPMILPPFKKEMAMQFRTSMTKVFNEVDLILRKAQKPPLASVRKKYFARFDKEIAGIVDTAFEGVLKEMDKTEK